MNNKIYKQEIFLRYLFKLFRKFNLILKFFKPI